MTGEEPPFFAFLRVMREAVLNEKRAAINSKADPVPSENERIAVLALLVRMPGSPGSLFLPMGAALGPFVIVFGRKRNGGTLSERRVGRLAGRDGSRK
jgi:hypothetical protein